MSTLKKSYSVETLEASPPPNPLLPLLLAAAAAEIALLVVGGALIVAELYAGKVGFEVVGTDAALAAAAAGKRGRGAVAIIVGIICIPGGTMYGFMPPMAPIIGFIPYAACKCGGIIFCICIILCGIDALKDSSYL
uniref:Uncharacterized protein n=1 Tax=Anopheles farauti TaxID=69004 RepID=A0A182Q879_9DIPT